MARPETPDIVVLGSVHMDLIASADALPHLGQSVTASGFIMAPGGKAANQACQLAQEGCEVAILTKLGNDAFGQTLEAALLSRAIDVSGVLHDPVVATGASTVFEVGGEYASIIAPGSAAAMTTTEIEGFATRIRAADALVLQLELPVELSLAAARIAAAAGVRVVLNASPIGRSRKSLAALLALTTLLVVNRAEARALIGLVDFAPHAMLPALAAKYGIATVVVTNGAAGSEACDGMTHFHQAAFAVDVVDSIGAGDAFLGALLACLCRTGDMSVALRRATMAAALTVARKGAFNAIPSRADIDRFQSRLALSS